jgi:hypothetical protein
MPFNKTFLSPSTIDDGEQDAENIRVRHRAIHINSNCVTSVIGRQCAEKMSIEQ